MVLAAAAAMQAREQNRLVFVQLDVDRDGMISLAEFAAVVGATPLQDVTPQLTRLDTDLDGVVAEAEMRAGNMAVPAC